MKLKGCLLILLFFCLVLVGVFSWMILEVGRVESVFGPAGNSVSFLQRVKYSLELRDYEEFLLNPVENADQRVTFQVESGMFSSEIATRLYAERLVLSKEAFQIYLSYKGYDRILQTGYYSFNRQMSPVEIGQHIAFGTSRQAILTVLPGWRLEQIAAQVGSIHINVTEQEFLGFVKMPSADYVFSGGVPTNTSLEGVLLPGDYLLAPDADLVMLMAAFNQAYENARIELGNTVTVKTFYDAVKIASIIQREAFYDDEYALMASVFYNRLNDGMLLQMDSTIQYALGFDDEQQTWWRMGLTYDEIFFDSLYNTYVYAGLPPTPISAPSYVAIHAALNPNYSDFYYFQAKCDGSLYHNFSQTYEEHQSYNCY